LDQTASCLIPTSCRRRTTRQAAEERGLIEVDGRLSNSDIAAPAHPEGRFDGA
jgi:hypothetical protein